MKICKAYPSTIRLNQVGGFIEALGIDAHHLNRLKDFTITRRTMKGSEFKMAGFPMYAKDGIIDDLISNKSRVAIYLQEENNTKETMKTTATRVLDKFISPGLAPLHSDYNFGPLCAVEIYGKEIELFFIDLTNGSSFKHLLPMSQKAVAEILLITQPSEIIVNGKLLNEDIYFGPNSYNPFHKDELYLDEDSPSFEQQLYSSPDRHIDFILKLATKSDILITPLQSDIFINPEHALKQFISWSLPKSSPNDTFFNFKPIQFRCNIPSYTQTALEYATTINDLDNTTTTLGSAELQARFKSPFCLKSDILTKQKETNAFFTIPKPHIAKTLEATKTFLKGIDAFRRNRFLSFMKSGSNADPSTWLNQFVQMHENTTELINYIDSDLRIDTNEQEIVTNWQSELSRIQKLYFPQLLLHFDSNGNISANTTDNELLQLNKDMNICASQYDSLISKFLENGVALDKDCQGLPTEYLKTVKKTPDALLKTMDLQPVTRAATNKRFTNQKQLEIYVRWTVLLQRFATIKQRYALDLATTIEQNNDEISKFESIIADIDVAKNWLILKLNNNDLGWCRPTILSENSGHVMTNGIHPLLATNGVKTPNSSFNKNQITTISGCNAGGKSTFLKTVSIMHILAQTGAFVPCDDFKFSIVTDVFIRTGSSDELRNGKSTFYIEAMELTDMMKKINKSSLVLVDELGSSTSIGDSVVMAMKFLNKMQGVQCIISTHTHVLCDYVAHAYKDSTHFHVKQINQKYDHLLYEGMSKASDGLELLSDMGMTINEQDKQLRTELNKETSVRCMQIIKQHGMEKDLINRLY